MLLVQLWRAVKSAHFASSWRNVEIKSGGHSAAVTSIEFGPDDKTVVSSSEDKKVGGGGCARAAHLVRGVVACVRACVRATFWQDARSHAAPVPRAGNPVGRREGRGPDHYERARRRRRAGAVSRDAADDSLSVTCALIDRCGSCLARASCRFRRTRQ